MEGGKRRKSKSKSSSRKKRSRSSSLSRHRSGAAGLFEQLKNIGSPYDIMPTTDMLGSKYKPMHPLGMYEMQGMPLSPSMFNRESSMNELASIVGDPTLNNLMANTRKIMEMKNVHDPQISGWEQQQTGGWGFWNPQSQIGPQNWGRVEQGLVPMPGETMKDRMERRDQMLAKQVYLNEIDTPEQMLNMPRFVSVKDEKYGIPIGQKQGLITTYTPQRRPEEGKK